MSFVLFGLLVMAVGIILSCNNAKTTSISPEAEFTSVVDSQEITRALDSVKNAPKSSAAYVQLATAYISEARRSGNFSLNAEARRAVTKALEIAPRDLAARRLEALLHLTYHEFDQALKLGEEIYSEAPDSFAMGVIVDAHTQLGNYPQAVEWAQKLVDTRPGSAAYARAALIRALHGDTKGAVELYELAFRSADPADKEAQSWCLSQLGDLYWRNGRFDDAEKTFDEALTITPNYPLALLGKGKTRAARGDFDAASTFVSSAFERSPHTSYAILLGDIKSKQGDSNAATKFYEIASDKAALGDLYDPHRIALMWADHNINLDQALEIAAADYSKIKDIYSSDILAWCLFKKGRLQESREKSQEALRLNTKDALLLYHAGIIEHALGNRSEAKKLLESALKLNPSFDLIQADVARNVLAGL